MQIKTKILSCHTADSKPVKEEVNGTVILLPLVFPGQTIFLTQAGDQTQDLFAFFIYLLPLYH